MNNTNLFLIPKLPSILSINILRYVPLHYCYTLRSISKLFNETLRNNFARKFLNIGYIPIFVFYSSFTQHLFVLEPSLFRFHVNSMLHLQVSAEDDLVYFQGDETLRHNFLNSLEKTNNIHFQAIAKTIAEGMNISVFYCMTKNYFLNVKHLQIHKSKGIKLQKGLELILVDRFLKTEKHFMCILSDDTLLLQPRCISMNDRYICLGLKSYQYYPKNPIVLIYHLPSNQYHEFKLSDYFEDCKTSQILRIVTLKTRFVLLWITLHLIHIGIFTFPSPKVLFNSNATKNKWEYRIFEIASLLSKSFNYFYSYPFAVNETSYCLYLYDQKVNTPVIKFFSLYNGRLLFTMQLASYSTKINANVINLVLTTNTLYCFHCAKENQHYLNYWNLYLN